MGAGAQSREAGADDDDPMSLCLDPMEPLMIARLACVCRGLNEAASGCAALDPVRDALRRVDPVAKYWNLSRPRERALKRAVGRAVGLAAASAYARERDELLSVVQSAARIASLFPDRLDGVVAFRDAAGAPAFRPGPLAFCFLQHLGLLHGATDAGFSFACAGGAIAWDALDFEDPEAGLEAKTRDAARRLFAMLGDQGDSRTLFACDDGGVLVLASPIGGFAPTRLPLGAWLERFAQRLEAGGCADSFRDCATRDFPKRAAAYALAHAADWDLEGDAYL